MPHTYQYIQHKGTAGGRHENDKVQLHVRLLTTDFRFEAYCCAAWGRTLCAGVGMEPTAVTQCPTPCQPQQNTTSIVRTV